MAELYEAAGIQFNKLMEKRAVLNKKNGMNFFGETFPDVVDLVDESKDADWFEEVREKWGFPKEDVSAVEVAFARLVNLVLAEERLTRFRFQRYPNEVIVRKMEDFLPGEVFRFPEFDPRWDLGEKRHFKFVEWKFVGFEVVGLENVGGAWWAVMERVYDKEKTTFSPSSWRMMERVGKEGWQEILEELEWFLSIDEVPENVYPWAEEWDWFWQGVQEKISISITEMMQFLRVWEQIRPRKKFAE